MDPGPPTRAKAGGLRTFSDPIRFRRGDSVCGRKLEWWMPEKAKGERWRGFGWPDRLGCLRRSQEESSMVMLTNSGGRISKAEKH